jgi:hypothetical protein
MALVTATRVAPWRRRAGALALSALLVGWAAPAIAGPVAPGIFSEFGFTDPGVSSTGCAPADPAGIFCTPSSGTPTVFLDAPPWTFDAAAGGATLTVIDAFESGDRFEVLDLGIPIGFTSVPAAAGAVDCGDDPVVCLATAGMSTGVFALAAGPHSITIAPTLSPSFLGAAYLRIDGPTVAAPQPVSLLVLAAGVIAAGFWSRTRRCRRPR